MKTCSCCHQIKPLDCFYKSKRNKDGYCGYCIDCDKEKKKAHYLAKSEEYKARAKKFFDDNPDKVREYKRNWKRNNPNKLKEYKHKRRALESQEHFTDKEWEALLIRYDGRCLVCGTTENISADHVIPLVLGGSNSIDNIQPLCVKHNCEKGIKIVDYREV